eukprot:352910-Amphidinium_carterae.1
MLEQQHRPQSALFDKAEVAEDLDAATPAARTWSRSRSAPSLGTGQSWPPLISESQSSKSMMKAIGLSCKRLRVLLDTLGFERRTFRMCSGRDATTPRDI